MFGIKALEILKQNSTKIIMIGNLSKTRNEIYQALTRELGAAGTVVFLRQMENGSGNYTEERRAELEKNSVETIADRIKNRNVQA